MFYRLTSKQEGKVIPSELKEGDKVLLPPYGGSAVKVDNEVNYHATEMRKEKMNNK